MVNLALKPCSKFNFLYIIDGVEYSLHPKPKSFIEILARYDPSLRTGQYKIAK